MIESGEDQGRDLSGLVVSRAGRLVATGDDREPYRVVGPDGDVVGPVSVFLRDLRASGKSAATLRSYPHSNEAVTEAVGPRCGRELTVAMPVTVGLLLPGPVFTREPCLQAAFEGRNQQEVRK